MSLFKKPIRSAAFALAAILVIAVVISCWAREEWTLRFVENAVRENVSQGEDKEKVHAWLRTKGWPFSDFNATTDELDQWAGQTVAEHAGVDRHEIASWTRVTLEKKLRSTTWPGWGTAWPRRIVIYFLFNKESKLIKSYLEEEKVMP